MLSPGVQQLIELALQEDLGLGDITTDSIFTQPQIVKAAINARQVAVVSGLKVAEAVMRRVDASIQVELKVQDGTHVTPGTTLISLEGPVASILKAERLALNFLQHLSGVASLTAQYVKAIEGTGVTITHTRKTTPGFRLLEIEAVVHGGGAPHRASLSHAVLIKDNHISACGSVKETIERARQAAGHTRKIEVECDTLAQVQEAVDAGADIILLDNMTLDELRQAVVLINKRAVLEASGGVNLNTVADIARTGVDVISTSQMTLSAPASDIGLDFI